MRSFENDLGQILVANFIPYFHIDCVTRLSVNKTFVMLSCFKLIDSFFCWLNFMILQVVL